MRDGGFTSLVGCDAFDGEVAEVIAQLVSSHAALPDDAVEDLRRLLSHNLARRDTARLRFGHLRLLIEMLRADDGRNGWVSQAQYSAEVARRAALGEHHPDEAVLRRAYGRWVCAVRAAARLAQRGGGNRVASSYHHCKLGQRPYGIPEVMDALLRAYADLAAWPTEWEYHEWAAIRRSVSRSDPRLPGAKQIRKCFGDFHTALAHTRRAYESSQEASPRPSSRPQRRSSPSVND